MKKEGTRFERIKRMGDSVYSKSKIFCVKTIFSGGGIEMSIFHKKGFISGVIVWVLLLSLWIVIPAHGATITIAPTNTLSVGNCIPFGGGGYLVGSSLPYSGFIYKNIPAFHLWPGDTLAFDLGSMGASNIQLDIAMAATTVNGGSVNAGSFTKVVSNTQTPMNARGDTVIGNFEVKFIAESEFNFPGGGLIIRFSNPSSSYSLDNSCSQVLVNANSADASGYFVQRFFGTSPVAPFLPVDTGYIGGFQLILNSLLISPNPKDFGWIAQGTSSAAQTFTLTNGVATNLSLGAIALTGTNSSEFHIQNDNCSNTTLLPSGTCTVDVIFSPTSGGNKSASLKALTATASLTGYSGVYTLSATAPGGHGTIACQSPVNGGSNSVCTITPDSGYYLSDLTDNGVTVPGSAVMSGGNLTYTFTNVTADHPSVVATFASGSAIRQTGQTTSYASRDDGGLQEGVAWPNPRFTVNTAAPDNGGSITDRLTGLTWMKDGSTPVVGSCVGGGKTWQQALDYVACLNTANYLGHNDWRLANRNELNSLFNSRTVPNSSWLISQGFNSVQATWYWSSTTVAASTTSAWLVNMADGNNGWTGKTSYSTYAWPVRGSSTSGGSAIFLPKTGQTTSYATGDDGAIQTGASAFPRFVDKGDGTVKDNLTGLTWLKNAACFGYQTWYNAVALSNSLANGACGLTDGSTAGQWRLPNREELASLLNAAYYNPALSTGLPFSNVQNNWYWSSTTYPGYSSYSYMVYMGYGDIAYTDKSSGFVVWPVKGGSLMGSAAISPPPSSNDFGSVDPGSSSSTQAFTITNTGTNNLYINTITKTGVNSDEFTLQDDNCSNTTVAPSGTCTVEVIFSPTTSGSKSASLSVPSNAPTSPTSISLTGTGAQYFLTVDKTGNGSGTVGGGGTFDANTHHDITAVADAGSTFTGWTGDCAGTASPLDVVVDSNKACTATFTLNQHTLSVNTSGNGSGTIGGGGTLRLPALAIM